jgi:hypothetical protein
MIWLWQRFLICATDGKVHIWIDTRNIHKIAGPSMDISCD